MLNLPFTPSKATSGKATGLLDLPVDLVELIASHLSLTDYRSFRLASRNLGLKSTSLFARRFLRTLSFREALNDEDGLRKLLSNDDIYRAVKEVSLTSADSYAFGDVMTSLDWRRKIALEYKGGPNGYVTPTATGRRCERMDFEMIEPVEESDDDAFTATRTAGPRDLRSLCWKVRKFQISFLEADSFEVNGACLAIALYNYFRLGLRVKKWLVELSNYPRSGECSMLVATFALLGQQLPAGSGQLHRSLFDLQELVCRGFVDENCLVFVVDPLGSFERLQRLTIYPTSARGLPMPSSETWLDKTPNLASLRHMTLGGRLFDDGFALQKILECGLGALETLHLVEICVGLTSSSLRWAEIFSLLSNQVENLRSIRLTGLEISRFDFGSAHFPRGTRQRQSRLFAHCVFALHELWMREGRKLDSPEPFTEWISLPIRTYEQWTSPIKLTSFAHKSVLGRYLCKKYESVHQIHYRGHRIHELLKLFSQLEEQPLKKPADSVYHWQRFDSYWIQVWGDC